MSAPRIVSICLLALLAQACAFAPAPDPVAYTEQQVTENVQTYLSVLFGERPPSIADYFRAEGPAPGLERSLERRECAFELAVPVESQSLRAAPACLEWIQERRRNAEMEPSLYYDWVREIAVFEPEHARIAEIVAPDDGEDYFRLMVEDEVNGTWLEMYHAAGPDGARISRLGISLINGEPVRGSVP